MLPRALFEMQPLTFTFSHQDFDSRAPYHSLSIQISSNAHRYGGQLLTSVELIDKARWGGGDYILYYPVSLPEEIRKFPRWGQPSLPKGRGSHMYPSLPCPNLDLVYIVTKR